MQNSQPPASSPWTQEVSDIFAVLDSNTAGLSSSEVEKRQLQYGLNELPPAASRPAWKRFLAQFNNILIYVLLISAAITGLSDHWIDTGVILGVVVLNAVIGFIQEGKAEQALRSMSSLLVSTCTVVRDGKRVQIAVKDVVPGDIIQLQAGDKIPADMRLIEAKQMSVDESMLTGESVSVEKQITSVAEKVSIGERTNMVFSGTLVTRGSGHGIVTSTGVQTELGKISKLLDTTESTKTPLLEVIDRFGRQLSLVIFIVAVITMLFGIFVRDLSLESMFLAAVGLFVAAIPEGLPAIITITLAVGVRQMAKKKAVVRKLPAVESLGAVTVICTDKTGTLTQNAMTVTHIMTADGAYTCSGTGYDPHGEISAESSHEPLTKTKTIQEASVATPLQKLLQYGALCNDAALLPPHTAENSDNTWKIIGDPTEAALLVAARKAGYEQDTILKHFPRTDTIPFASETKLMATMHHSHNGQSFIVLKGAPEELLKRCHNTETSADNAPVDLTFWENHMRERALKGERTLGVAVKYLDHVIESLDEKDIAAECTFLGFLSISDPPRDSAKNAVKRCRDAGIVVKMITGDHALTAEAIAAQVGIEIIGTAITGQQLEEANDDELLRLATSSNVFARVSPEHKIRLVTALQKAGELVAMTGDGVNDAPALRRADIGVAMGQNGTEVAREAGRMILLDDRFETIAEAVSTGRNVYDNIIKSLVFILPTSFAEALLIVFAILFGFSMPLTALQILWVNLITEVSLSLALAMEPAEAGIMQRKPRKRTKGLLNTQETLRAVIVTAIFVAISLGAFYYMLAVQGASLPLAQTVTVNMVVLLEIACLFSTRSIHSSVLSPKVLFSNTYIILSAAGVFALQLAFTYMPLLQNLFGTVALGAHEWIVMGILTLVGFILMECEKPLRRKLSRQ